MHNMKGGGESSRDPSPLALFGGVDHGSILQFVLACSTLDFKTRTWSRSSPTADPGSASGPTIFGAEDAINTVTALAMTSSRSGVPNRAQRTTDTKITQTDTANARTASYILTAVSMLLSALEGFDVATCAYAWRISRWARLAYVCVCVCVFARFPTRLTTISGRMSAKLLVAVEGSSRPTISRCHCSCCCCCGDLALSITSRVTQDRARKKIVAK